MPKKAQTVHVATGPIEVSKLYLVKYERNGQTVYGHVEQYSDRGKQATRQGKAVVDHAILPVCDTIPFADLTPIEMNFVHIDEYHEYVDAELKKAIAYSNSLPDGAHNGKLFSVGVADGQAWYVVTKVNKKSVKVEWRGFCPDNYSDQVLGMGGTFPRDGIESLCCCFKPFAM
jgi:hypothetical protein